MDEQKSNVVLEDHICSDCENYLAGPSGAFCRRYVEEILDETVANECPDYNPLPWAGKRVR